MNENQDPESPASLTEYIHSWHYDMLISKERNQFYSDLIKDHCKDKVVFEIGSGAGLLAVLAIKHGAKKVICCEENPYLAKVAKQLFKRMGYEDRIELIPKNSKAIKTDEIPKVDVVLHELFGSDPFCEEFIPTLSDAARFMKPDAIFLPEKIQILYQPIRSRELPEKVAFEDIQLTEMTDLLARIHPSLRKQVQKGSEAEVYALPEVSIADILTAGTYTFKEKNPKLVDVDAVNVSFYIIHGKHRFQAAEFEEQKGRVHWFPLCFYKVDEQADEISFFVKDQIQLMLL